MKITESKLREIIREAIYHEVGKQTINEFFGPFKKFTSRPKKGSSAMGKTSLMTGDLGAGDSKKSSSAGGDYSGGTSFSDPSGMGPPVPQKGGTFGDPQSFESSAYKTPYARFRLGAPADHNGHRTGDGHPMWKWAMGSAPGPEGSPGSDPKWMARVNKWNSETRRARENDPNVARAWKEFKMYNPDFFKR